MAARLFNLALYQTGWFCCVLSAAAGNPWPGTLVALSLIGVHLALISEPAAELRVILLAALLGGIADSLQSCAGLLEFRSGSVLGCLAPPWILVMWMQFVTLFRFGLSFLAGRPALAVVLGALGGPLAFWIGSRMGAVDFPAPAIRSLLVLGLVWGGTLPLLLRFAAGQYPDGWRASYRGFPRSSG